MQKRSVEVIVFYKTAPFNTSFISTHLTLFSTLCYEMIDPKYACTHDRNDYHKNHCKHMYPPHRSQKCHLILPIVQDLKKKRKRLRQKIVTFILFSNSLANLL